jgi:hypothetical protein
LTAALATKPEGLLIGEHLIRLGLIREEELYEALSLQQGLRLMRLDAGQVPKAVARSLPHAVAESWQVLPYRVAEGALYIAGPNLPTPQMHAAIRGHTSLEIRFCLTTRSDFLNAARAVL